MLIILPSLQCYPYSFTYSLHWAMLHQNDVLSRILYIYSTLALVDVRMSSVVQSHQLHTCTAAIYTPLCQMIGIQSCILNVFANNTSVIRASIAIVSTTVYCVYWTSIHLCYTLVYDNNILQCITYYVLHLYM